MRPVRRRTRASASATTRSRSCSPASGSLPSSGPSSAATGSPSRCSRRGPTARIARPPRVLRRLDGARRAPVVLDRPAPSSVRRSPRCRSFFPSHAAWSSGPHSACCDRRPASRSASPAPSPSARPRRSSPASSASAGSTSSSTSRSSPARPSPACSSPGAAPCAGSRRCEPRPRRPRRGRHGRARAARARAPGPRVPTGGPVAGGARRPSGPYLRGPQSDGPAVAGRGSRGRAAAPRPRTGPDGTGPLSRARQSREGGSMSPVTVLYNRALDDDATNDSTSTVGEPSVAVSGAQVFVTGNWYASASTNGGADWTFVDPYTTLPSAAGGFCCDQVTLHDQARGIWIWILQYVQQGGSNVFRIAVTRDADFPSGWYWWDIAPTTV